MEQTTSNNPAMLALASHLKVEIFYKESINSCEFLEVVNSWEPEFLSKFIEYIISTSISARLEHNTKKQTEWDIGAKWIWEHGICNHNSST